MLGQGATIGAYRILHKIGEGGMGTVYLGEHTLLGRRAAIKVLLPWLSSNKEIVQRFLNEARAAARIADPGVVQIFDFGVDTDGSAFIVMELLEGESMARRLERIGRFGLLEGLRMMRLIGNSLAVGHSRGIVHRDLKPENIFIVGDPAVTGGERAKILDFGIAKLSGDDPSGLKTRTGAMIGTPVYMSPEQCRGSDEVDHRADVYSAGGVLFTMLTGRPPFDAPSSADLIAAHLREAPPPPSSRVPELPGVIDEIVLRCLAKSPADRFASMTELVHALAAAETAAQRSSVPTVTLHLSGAAPSLAAAAQRGATTLSSASGQAAASPPRRAPRSRAWITRLAVAALVIGGGVAIALSRAGQSSGPPALPSLSPASAPSPAPEPATATRAPPIEAPAAPVAESAAAQPTRDAGIVDAPAIVEVTDAAAPATQPSNTRERNVRSNPGGDHASQTRPPRLPTIDRGD